jgi:hypothetical protein
VFDEWVRGFVCVGGCMCVEKASATKGCKGASSKQWELGSVLERRGGRMCMVLLVVQLASLPSACQLTKLTQHLCGIPVKYLQLQLLS